jgi:hypothetical protein
MLTVHSLRITNRNDGSSFHHGPIYAHTTDEAIALARLTFGPALWDASISAASNEAEKMHTVSNDTSTQLSLL